MFIWKIISEICLTVDVQGWSDEYLSNNDNSSAKKYCFNMICMGYILSTLARLSLNCVYFDSIAPIL